jgi:hypothetical protein
MAMNQYWEENPPIYTILRTIAAGLFGKDIGKAPSEQKDFTPSSVESLMQGLGGPASTGGPGVYGR